MNSDHFVYRGFAGGLEFMLSKVDDPSLRLASSLTWCCYWKDWIPFLRILCRSFVLLQQQLVFVAGSDLLALYYTFLSMCQFNDRYGYCIAGKSLLRVPLDAR